MLRRCSAYIESDKLAMTFYDIKFLMVRVFVCECVCLCVNERKIHLSFMVKLYRRQCISTIVLSIPSNTYSDTLRASIQVAVQFLASQNTHNQITAIAIIQEAVIDETYAQKLVKLIFPFRPDTHNTSITFPFPTTQKYKPSIFSTNAKMSFENLVEVVSATLTSS